MAGIRLRSVAFSMLLIGSMVGACGCAVEEVPPPAYADGYGPMYYDGYVVYYDDVGRPYYYANGVVFWVPPDAPVYGALVAHWRLYGPRYRSWYAHYGYRYRSYRGGRR